ncbi:MAG: superoxide dismutase family protein [Chthoniobacterales bacterium]
MKNLLSFTIAAAILSLGASHAAAAEPTKAIAVLSAASGSEVAGTITFASGSDGVKVVAAITGLKPGKHGFHVHEFGDCSAKDGTSAGGHYNPTKHPHAGPDAEMRHMGDLGNLEADASGKAHVEMTDKTLKLSGENSIVGYAVIVHEKADDLKSQPTGDAGGRVACGVIGVAKP